MKSEVTTHAPAAAESSARAERLVGALIDAGLLAAQNRPQALRVAADALGQPVAAAAAPDQRRPRPLPQLFEVVAYLGGALVLAAGALFLVQEWGRLGFVQRVAMLSAVTVVLAMAGALTSRGRRGATLEADDTRRRLASSLLTGAAVSFAFLVGYLLDERSGSPSHGVYWPAVAGALSGALFAAVAYRFAPTAVGLVGLMVGLFTAAVTVGSGLDTAASEGDNVGVLLFLLGLAWLAGAERRWLRELTIARSLGVATALFGAQVPTLDGTHAWLGYSLTGLLAVGGIAFYLKSHAWPYLAAAVLSVTLVVPEAVADWTDGSLGATGGVLVAGITLLVASFGGYRLRAEARG